MGLYFGRWVHTTDIFQIGKSKDLASTKRFTQMVIANLGKKPKALKPLSITKETKIVMPEYKRKPAADKVLKGVDIFVDWDGQHANELADLLKYMESDIKLSMITNRCKKYGPMGLMKHFVRIIGDVDLRLKMDILPEKEVSLMRYYPLKKRESM